LLLRTRRCTKRRIKGRNLLDCFLLGKKYYYRYRRHYFYKKGRQGQCSNIRVYKQILKM
jgi:hypothetical protein